VVDSGGRTNVNGFNNFSMRRRVPLISGVPTVVKIQWSAKQSEQMDIDPSNEFTFGSLIIEN
jgi:hypothetical protein